MWTPDLSPYGAVKYLAIVDALAAAIAAGELRPGDRLPTHRALAWRLKVNVSTVTKAYLEATRRHLIGGEVGRGTYALADSREAALFALKEGAPGVSSIDLSTNVPAQWPEKDELAVAVSRTLSAGAVGSLQGYHLPALVERARVCGATWLASRGLELRPRDVVPCAGAQQALMAVLLSLCSPDDPVLVEELTFPGMKAVARQLRLRLVGVAMDHEGILPDALDRAARTTKARVAVVVPSLQNPTGAVMSAERRRAVAAVAERRRLTLVEDDVYGALTDWPPLATEAPERTIVVTSLSKVVAPPLRFGLVAGRAPAMQAISAEVHATVWPMAPPMVELACRWIEDGTAARRLAWQRAETQARFRLAARDIVRGPGTSIPAPHVWLETAYPSDEAARRASEAGVVVVPSSFFTVGHTAPHAVRVSLTAAASRRELHIGLERLRPILKTQTTRPSSRRNPLA